jgi:Kef-type K+ transport system membrane component KefB
MMLPPAIAEITDQIVYNRSSTLNLLLVMVVIWTVGVISRRIKQPALLGELLAGIILGPALFNIIQPDDTLKVLSDLGVFFLMFYAGLETDPSHLTRFKRMAFQVGAGGYVIPFIMGYGACRLFGLDLVQALFVGQALSITAIAVSARVLHDMDLMGCRVGPVILGASVIDDVISLIVFSILIELATGQGGIDFLTIVHSLAKVVVFFGVTMGLGMWLFPKLRKHLAVREAKGFTFSLIIALFFGFFAEISGLHLIIGAYIAGIFVRGSVSGTALFGKINDRFVSITYGFLGPIFFFSLSFHVTFDIVQTHFLMLFILLAVAVIGKYVGSGLGALWGGMNRAEASVVGITMNGRGAVELIIASVGLEMGIIDDSLFSILVIIAFFTTVLPPLTLQAVCNRVKEKLVCITEPWP